METPAPRGLSRSEEDRVFLQDRVALFGLVMGSGYLFFLGYRAAVLLVMNRTGGFLDPTFWWHFTAGAAFVALWVACRSGTPRAGSEPVDRRSN